MCKKWNVSFFCVFFCYFAVLNNQEKKHYSNKQKSPFFYFNLKEFWLYLSLYFQPGFKYTLVRLGYCCCLLYFQNTRYQMYLSLFYGLFQSPSMFIMFELSIACLQSFKEENNNNKKVNQSLKRLSCAEREE